MNHIEKTISIIKGNKTIQKLALVNMPDNLAANKKYFLINGAN